MIFTDFEVLAVFQRGRHLDNLTEQFDDNVIDYIHVRVLLGLYSHRRIVTTVRVV
jgi:hypothetical protein